MNQVLERAPAGRAVRERRDRVTQFIPACSPGYYCLNKIRIMLAVTLFQLESLLWKAAWPLKGSVDAADNCRRAFRSCGRGLNVEKVNMMCELF